MTTQADQESRLSLAAPALLAPKGGVFEAMHNGTSRQILREWNFGHTLTGYLVIQAARSPSSSFEASLGVDPIVIPYLSHFCSLFAILSEDSAKQLLAVVDPKAESFNKLSTLLKFCARLLQSFHDERSSEPSEENRLTTSLEVHNRLTGTVMMLDNEKVRERLIEQLKGPLNTWRKDAMRIYATAAGVPHFTACCQLAFNQYTANVRKSLIDTSAAVDRAQIQKVESAPELRLQPVNTMNFRIEAMAAVGMVSQVQTEPREVPYTVYAPLQYAIEHYVLSENGFPSLSGRFPEDRAKVKLRVSQLVCEFGFDQYSARQLLSQVYGITFS